MADSFGFATGSDERLEWLLKCSPCTFENAYDIAETYDIRKEYAKAAEYYETALRGLEPVKKQAIFKYIYARALEKLSNYYAEGREVERDPTRALELKLALIAVESDSPSDYSAKHLAEVKEKQYYFIGSCYHHGDGCKQDYEKAEEYYKKMSLAEQYRCGDEMHELLSHKCPACGRYLYNTVEKRTLFGTVNLCCPHCGKKVGKKK